MKPDISKVEAVISFPTPQTKKQVKAFFGLTGYYRTFIPDFTSVVAPLTDLIKKQASNIVSWTKQCDEAFNRLCSSQTSDFSKPFILQIHASDRGIGAILNQNEEW